MADFMVVDADSHIQENREALLKHVDGPARRRFAMEDRPWVYFPRNSWDFSLGGHFGRLDTGASEYLRLLDQAGVEQVVPYMIEAHTLIHPFGQMRQLTSLIFRGALERFPGIRFACLETAKRKIMRENALRLYRLS